VRLRAPMSSAFSAVRWRPLVNQHAVRSHPLVTQHTTQTTTHSSILQYTAHITHHHQMSSSVTHRCALSLIFGSQGKRKPPCTSVCSLLGFPRSCCVNQHTAPPNEFFSRAKLRTLIDFRVLGKLGPSRSYH
jgi:hypothetical protein